MKKKYSLIALIISLSILCTFTTTKNITSKQSSQLYSVKSEIYDSFNDKKIDKKILQKINEFLNENLQNCQVQQQSGLVYDCDEIAKQDYPQFLYDFFSQQLFNDFLKKYQQKMKKSIKNNQKEMKKFKQQVYNMLIEAYSDFVQVYRPYQKVTVQEIYDDMIGHDLTMLKFVEHYPEKYIDLINVLKQRVGKQAVSPRQYLSVKGKTKEESKQDQAKIFQTYFRNCTSQTQCKISIKAYAFYLKDLFFYSNPQIGRVQNGYLNVRSETDFQVTQYFIKQTKKMKSKVGELENHEDRNSYFRDLVKKLQQLLRKKELKNYITSTQKQEEVSFEEQL